MSNAECDLSGFKLQPGGFYVRPTSTSFTEFDGAYLTPALMLKACTNDHIRAAVQAKWTELKGKPIKPIAKTVEQIRAMRKNKFLKENPIDDPKPDFCFWSVMASTNAALLDADIETTGEHGDPTYVTPRVNAKIQFVVEKATGSHGYSRHVFNNNGNWRAPFMESELPDTPMLCEVKPNGIVIYPYATSDIRAIRATARLGRVTIQEAWDVFHSQN